MVLFIFCIIVARWVGSGLLVRPETDQQINKSAHTVLAQDVGYSAWLQHRPTLALSHSSRRFFLHIIVY
jgi:hypothetical protein